MNFARHRPSQGVAADPFEVDGRNEIGERANRRWFYASVNQGGYGGVNLISA